MPSDASVTIDAAETIARLDPDRLTNDLSTAMWLAVGLTHRTLMSLKREGTPPDEQGILPVMTGRLAGSFQMGVEPRGNDLVGAVGTNLIYAYGVNTRRRFIETTIRRVRGPVNDLLSAATENF